MSRTPAATPALSLYHFNHGALALSCALRVGGYSANRRKLGGVAMGLGLLGLLLVILNSIHMGTNGTPIWAP